MVRLLPLPTHSLSSSLQNSLAEGQQLRVRTSAHQDADGLLLKDSSDGGSRNSSSCDFEDFVMVPAHFTGKNPVRTWGSSEFFTSLLSDSSSVPAADLKAEGLQDSLTTSG